jgi:hypothetical protein
MIRRLPFVILLLLAPVASAKIRVTVERNQKDAATGEFRFQKVPGLSDADAGQEAAIEVIDGKPDWGCDPKQLIDGGGPANPDDAWRSFRFGQNTNSGRIRIDLGSAKAIAQVNTYSWNSGARASQVYTLYGADGLAPTFSPTPRKGVDPVTVGWTKIAAVDTRPEGFLKNDGGGGQYGVSVTDDKGAALGRFRYVLWDIAATSHETWASTFYAEFDVVTAGAPAPSRLATITLKSGKTLEGPAYFDADALVVKQADDAEQRVALADIATATFRTPPPPAPQPDEPSAGGLKAEYFDDQDLQQKRLVRYDPVINFQWGLAAPDPSVNVDFSARWTGRIEPKFTETYTFHTHADDGVRLWIDGRLIIDRWNDGPPYQQQGTMALEGGHNYDIRIEYHDKMAEASMQLAWSSPSQPRQIVPASRLSPPENDPAAPPRVVLTAPAAERWRIAPGTLELEATVRAAGSSPAGAPATNQKDTGGQAARGTLNSAIARVEFFSGNTLLGTATTPPYKFTWIHVPPGHHRLTARATDEAGTITASAPVTVNVAANGSGSLPGPWGSMRLGPSERSDSSAYSGGMFTLRAGGGELRGAFDSGYFVAQPLDGDGQITVRVGDVTTDGAPNAVAGVMIRETLSGDARYAALLAGKEGTEYLRRWEPASWVSASDITRAVPCYLRLNRTGKSFKAYVSDNGSSWQLVGTDQLSMSAQAFVGLIGTSRSDDAMCTATLDHVRVTAGSPPMDAPVAGVRTRGGTFLAGEIGKVDAAAGIELTRPRGRNFTFPPGEVARVYLKPAPEELAASIPRGRAGVLLAAGDFYEGEFRGFKDGRVTVDSVLFGARSFEPNDVLAIVLHDVNETGSQPMLTTADGSTFVAKGLKIESGRVLVRDEAAGEFSVSIRDIDRIQNR